MRRPTCGNFNLLPFTFNLLLLFFLSLPAPALASEDSITTYEAVKHIGTLQKVCGYCVGGLLEKREKGEPTYLYFEYMYTRSVFRIKIWGYDRQKFREAPEVFYKDKALCVSGNIEAETGSPFIYVTEPGQIEDMKPYEVDTEEEMELQESVKFHKMLFKPKDRIALKIVLKSLGYGIAAADDSWGMDAHRAVLAFEKDNKLKIDGRVKRGDLMAMEDAVARNKKIPYRKQMEYWNMLEKLLKRQM